VQTADYVEARAILQPAVDFFARAVEIARIKGCLTGKLLEKVPFLLHPTDISIHGIDLQRPYAQRAEALMSLGNVSPMSVGRVHFRDAVQALQVAVSIGHSLPRHLQRYARAKGIPREA